MVFYLFLKLYNSCECYSLMFFVASVLCLSMYFSYEIMLSFSPLHFYSLMTLCGLLAGYFSPEVWTLFLRYFCIFSSELGKFCTWKTYPGARRNSETRRSPSTWSDSFLSYWPGGACLLTHKDCSIVRELLVPHIRDDFPASGISSSLHVPFPPFTSCLHFERFLFNFVVSITIDVLLLLLKNSFERCFLKWAVVVTSYS